MQSSRPAGDRRSTSRSGSAADSRCVSACSAAPRAHERPRPATAMQSSRAAGDRQSTSRCRSASAFAGVCRRAVQPAHYSARRVVGGRTAPRVYNEGPVGSRVAQPKPNMSVAATLPVSRKVWWLWLLACRRTPLTPASASHI